MCPERGLLAPGFCHEAGPTPGTPLLPLVIPQNPPVTQIRSTASNPPTGRGHSCGSPRAGPGCFLGSERLFYCVWGKTQVAKQSHDLMAGNA